MCIPSAHAHAVHTVEGARPMEMVSPAKFWTVADLADLPDDGNRYEVIDGELHVTPAPTFDHQRAILHLYSLLAPYVKDQRLGEIIVAPADVVFSDKRGVQPDLFVMPFANGRRARSFVDVGRLLLAVEVLSPSTRQWDRVTKRQLYRDHGVPENWVIDLEARVIERTTPRDHEVETLAERLVWSPEGAGDALELDVAEYFREVLAG